MNLPLGGEFQSQHHAAQAPDIAAAAVAVAKLPAQHADAADDAVQLRRRLGRSGEPVPPKFPRVPRANPQTEQDQIDIKPGAVLQGDQRIGNSGPRVQRERKPPEGRAVALGSLGRPIGRGRRLIAYQRVTVHDIGAIHAIIEHNGNSTNLDAPNGASTMDLDVEALKAKLTALRTEHRDLDDVIARIVEHGPFDQLQMQRLKKRKLLLKDQISKIESELLPDIIA